MSLLDAVIFFVQCVKFCMITAKFMYSKWALNFSAAYRVAHRNQLKKPWKLKDDCQRKHTQKKTFA
jgi:hypothetical protein